MNSRWFLASLVLIASSSQAAEGLSPPTLDSLWPQWQARVQLQTGSLLPFGAPLYKTLPGQVPSLSVQGNGLQPTLLQLADNPQPLPYLGLGFSAAPQGGGFSISADLGLVSKSPGSSVELGRALLGNQSVERAFRELRLSPMAQLSVRYSF